MENTKIIVLEQKPIITYSLIEQKGKEVQELINSLDLDNIEANEANLRTLKTTRTDLNKEFKIFEEQRKMVKELIMKPYNDFDEAYKKHISSLFKDTDLQLKAKVDAVDALILDKKINGIVEYFNEINKYDFIAFDDLELKIIKSKTDKSIKEEIDTYLSIVEANLKMIDTLADRDRILVKYQMHKDINRAISETQIESKRETELKEQEQAKIKAAEQAREEKDKLLAEQEAKQEQEQATYVESMMIEPKKTQKIFKARLTVFGTKEQFADLKKYMNEKGIKYEN
jgi:hypothetical protein